MIIKIETYRSYEISFDTEKETFLSDIGNNGTTKKSYSATKKAIDDYIKENSAFVPFDVVRVGYAEPKKYTITGIRKDGRFIFERDGEKKQFSEYDEEYTYLLEDLSDFDYTELNRLLEERISINAKIRDIEKLEKKFLSSKPTLRDLKSKYLPL